MDNIPVHGVIVLSILAVYMCYFGWLILMSTIHMRKFIHELKKAVRDERLIRQSMEEMFAQYHELIADMVAEETTGKDPREHRALGYHDRKLLWSMVLTNTELRILVQTPTGMSNDLIDVITELVTHYFSLFRNVHIHIVPYDIALTPT